jgi:hypothetical protein
LHEQSAVIDRSLLDEARGNVVAQRYDSIGPPYKLALQRHQQRVAIARMAVCIMYQDDDGDSQSPQCPKVQ